MSFWSNFKKPKLPGRRDCIFISAGDHEVFASYSLRYLKSRFYVIIVFYGTSKSKKKQLRGGADEFYARSGSKFQNLHYVYHKSSSRIKLFDTVTVWDDDARIQKGSLSDIVDVLNSSSELLIAGAAQHAAGLLPHWFMRPVYENYARVTNFTEMNFVTFKRESLSMFMGAYDGKLVGWGMDMLFCQIVDPSLCGGVICIVDTVVVLNRQKRLFGVRRGLDLRTDLPNYRSYISEMDNFMPREDRAKQWDAYAESRGLKKSYEFEELDSFYVGTACGVEPTGVVYELPVTKRFKDVRAYHKNSDLKISAVCACMNRIDNLLKSLPTWLNCPYITEIIVVDWASDSPIMDNEVIRYFVDAGYVRIIRVEDESYFSLGKAYNLAVDMAVFDVVIKLDTDYAIKSSTWMDYLLLDRKTGTRLADYYIRGAWWFSESFGGFCVFNKSDFVWYNERLVGWGHDDTDLYERFDESGVTSVIFNSLSDYIFHIPHSTSERTENYPIKDRRKSERANRKLAHRNSSVARSPYDILYRTHKYSIVEYRVKHM